jgi:hypothetical protein
MEERIFLEADVDEHRLQAVLDVFDAAFENAPDDVAIGFALDAVFLEHSVLHQGDAPFEFFGIDDQFVPGLSRGQTEQSFDAIGHEKDFGVDFF